MEYKIGLSLIAIGLTFAAFLPYIRAILLGAIRPHVFSWMIWGSTTFVVFLAQLEDKGGIGAWPIGVSGCLTLFIALLAYGKRGDITITGSDWLFFAAAMSSLPFWYFTADPMWAVVILTSVDVLGFGPTVRKAWHRPHSESLTFFMLFMARNLLVIVALEHYSLTTVLFPAVIALSCALLIGMVSYRRSRLQGVS
ncbi:MAG: hypothetical protein P8045_05315 [Candidatus Thiodiazotropha sp.]